MGAIGTGKSVYKGLEIVTNKITHAEKQGVRHYLLGEIEPDFDLMAKNFYSKSIVYIEFFLKTQCVPIIVGGSNSYIEKLVVDLVFMFKYNTFHFQIYVQLNKAILKFMLHAELVAKVRQIFSPDADYTKGIRWSIGVPEMTKYLREEKNIDGDNESKKMILQSSISSIKHNTCILICSQLDKIQQLIND
ncbi:hypothetical protein H5410_021346 [Solanum commersonii]|uniref:Isopentenyltransferase n=1 Tax=Solanum commersonii TaxID=4109 RepID=A0A9J5ZB32_SOLCO|nr:hypothetical protein H5410_021346 [Solanum commersonii]